MFRRTSVFSFGGQPKVTTDNESKQSSQRRPQHSVKPKLSFSGSGTSVRRSAPNIKVISSSGCESAGSVGICSRYHQTSHSSTKTSPNSQFSSGVCSSRETVTPSNTASSLSVSWQPQHRKGSVTTGAAKERFREVLHQQVAGDQESTSSSSADLLAIMTILGSPTPTSSDTEQNTDIGRFFKDEKRAEREVASSATEPSASAATNNRSIGRVNSANLSASAKTDEGQSAKSVAALTHQQQQKHVGWHGDKKVASNASATGKNNNNNANTSVATSASCNCNGNEGMSAELVNAAKPQDSSSATETSGDSSRAAVEVGQQKTVNYHRSIAHYSSAVAPSVSAADITHCTVPTLQSSWQMHNSASAAAADMETAASKDRNQFSRPDQQTQQTLSSPDYSNTASQQHQPRFATLPGYQKQAISTAAPPMPTSPSDSAAFTAPHAFHNDRNNLSAGPAATSEHNGFSGNALLFSSLSNKTDTSGENTGMICRNNQSCISSQAVLGSSLWESFTIKKQHELHERQALNENTAERSPSLTTPPLGGSTLVDGNNNKKSNNSMKAEAFGPVEQSAPTFSTTDTNIIHGRSPMPAPRMTGGGGGGGGGAAQSNQQGFMPGPSSYQQYQQHHMPQQSNVQYPPAKNPLNCIDDLTYVGNRDGSNLSFDGRMSSRSGFSGCWETSCGCGSGSYWLAPRICICIVVWVGAGMLFGGLVLFLQGRFIDERIFVPISAALMGTGGGLLFMGFILCVRGYLAVKLPSPTRQRSKDSASKTGSVKSNTDGNVGGTKTFSPVFSHQNASYAQKNEESDPLVRPSLSRPPSIKTQHSQSDQHRRPGWAVDEGTTALTSGHTTPREVTPRIPRATHHTCHHHHQQQPAPSLTPQLSLADSLCPSASTTPHHQSSSGVIRIPSSSTIVIQHPSGAVGCCLHQSVCRCQQHVECHFSQNNHSLTNVSIPGTIAQCTTMNRHKQVASQRVVRQPCSFNCPHCCDCSFCQQQKHGATIRGRPRSQKEHLSQSCKGLNEFRSKSADREKSVPSMSFYANLPHYQPTRRQSYGAIGDDAGSDGDGIYQTLPPRLPPQTSHVGCEPPKPVARMSLLKKQPQLQEEKPQRGFNLHYKPPPTTNITGKCSTSFVANEIRQDKRQAVPSKSHHRRQLELLSIETLPSAINQTTKEASSTIIADVFTIKSSGTGHPQGQPTTDVCQHQISPEASQLLSSTATPTKASSVVSSADRLMRYLPRGPMPLGGPDDVLHEAFVMSKTTTECTNNTCPRKGQREKPASQKQGVQSEHEEKFPDTMKTSMSTSRSYGDIQNEVQSSDLPRSPQRQSAFTVPTKPVTDASVDAPPPEYNAEGLSSTVRQTSIQQDNNVDHCSAFAPVSGRGYHPIAGTSTTFASLAKQESQSITTQSTTTTPSNMAGRQHAVFYSDPASEDLVSVRLTKAVKLGLDEGLSSSDWSRWEQLQQDKQTAAIGRQINKQLTSEISGFGGQSRSAVPIPRSRQSLPSAHLQRQNATQDDSLESQDDVPKPFHTLPQFEWDSQEPDYIDF